MTEKWLFYSKAKSSDAGTYFQPIGPLLPQRIGGNTKLGRCSTKTTNKVAEEIRQTSDKYPMTTKKSYKLTMENIPVPKKSLKVPNSCMEPPKTAFEYDWVIRNIYGAIAQDDYITETPTFCIAGQNVHVKIVFGIEFHRSYLNNAQIQMLVMCVQFTDEKLNKELDEKMTDIKVTYSIKDHKELQPTDKVFERARQFQEYLVGGRNTFTQSLLSVHELVQGTFISVNKITVKIAFEFTPLPTNVPANGIMIWELKNFKNVISKDPKSPTFYTSCLGYRVQIQLIELRGKINAYVHFVYGRYDRNLPSRYLHQLRINLKCRSDESKNIICGITMFEAKCYRFELASKARICNEVVCNDTLYMEIQIEPVKGDKQLNTYAACRLKMQTLLYKTGWE